MSGAAEKGDRRNHDEAAGWSIVSSLVRTGARQAQSW